METGIAFIKNGSDQKSTMVPEIKQALLRCLGFTEPRYRPKLQNEILLGIERALGWYDRAKAEVDDQPRPCQIRDEAQEIHEFSSKLLEKVNAADIQTLFQISRAGYDETEWSQRYEVKERFFVLTQLLSLLSPASRTVVSDNKTKKSRHRKPTFATKYVVWELEKIFEKFHKIPKEMCERPEILKKCKAEFIETAVKNTGIPLPRSWRQHLRLWNKES